MDRRRTLSLSGLLGLFGAFLTVLALSAGTIGNVHAALTVACLLPIAGAVAGFKLPLSPLAIASSMSVPLSLISLVLAIVGPSTWPDLVAVVLPLAAFLAVLVAAMFGQWRKRANP